MEEAPEIGGVLSEYLRQSNAQAGLAYGGISVSGYRAEAQSYTVPGLRSGVVGVWYCRGNMTLYRLDYMRLGQRTLDALAWSMSEGQEEHKRYMKSFRCLSESDGG